MKLLILDGNSVINRAYFGVKPLTTRDGLYTHAIYGFLNILERMQKEEQPDAVAVAFDLHGPTFRHLRYDGYKATRHAMPEELAQQMPIMKQVLHAMRIPIYECQGWEADDVIGTVGRICSEHAWQCVIVTGDRDSLQLIDDHVNVKLVISKPGQTNATLYTRELFEEEYGFEPKKLIDLKALMGDSSDNIPGVAGVGPKTAKELLLKFGSLNGVYSNLGDASIRPKLREKLENGKESAYLSYELATIIPEAPIEFTPENALCQPCCKQELYELFQKLEFVRLIDKYGLRGAAAEAAARENARRVQEAKEREARLKAEAAKAAEERRDAEARRRAEQAARQAEADREAAERKAAVDKKRHEQEVAKAKKEEETAATVSTQDRALSRNFESNRGRLPMPITGGYRIVSHFGQYNVEGLKNVQLDNKGINIQGSSGACARAIFNGEVSAVFGFGGTMVVMVRHGSYISVYCNLRSVSVHRGQQVSTRQTLGVVGNDNILQFQLRKGFSKLNPEAWLGR